MRNLVGFFLKFYLFWIIFFLFFRILFLFSIYPSLLKFGTLETLQSLIAGIQLDLSTISYFFIIPLLICILKVFGLFSLPEKLLKWYSSIILFIIMLLCLSNIIIYNYWGTLLNNRALAYIAQPKEMLASVSNFQLIILIVVITGLFYFIRKFYFRYVIRQYQKINTTIGMGLVGIIAMIPVIFLAIRGGLQLIPINESSAIYSDHHELNQVAINPVWFLGHNLNQSGLGDENPYKFMDEKTAIELTDKLLHKSENDTGSIFRFSAKPNVVIILLESWTADVIEPLGGVKGVTPNFTELSKSGLLFTSIYSSGFRTDQALTSVLSGFPSQPNKSIIRFPAKAASLPSLSKEFKAAGYSTSFYYGGELGFANMNNYLKISGVEKIISISDFASNTQNSKWGAHDEFVLRKHLNDLNNQTEPFFSTLLTLSTHEPFEVPVQTPFNGSSEAEQFKKSAWYTDQCLGEYFKNVKNTSWFENTIFILLADHGHRLPLTREYFDPEMRRIPVLIVSNLLKNEYIGSTDSTIATQHDIASTILSNLGMDDRKFYWSVNITDKERNSFAYLSLDFAFTWKDEQNTFVIPLQAGMENFGSNAPQVVTPKAYLQHLYQTFSDY